MYMCHVEAILGLTAKATTLLLRSAAQTILPMTSQRAGQNHVGGETHNTNRVERRFNEQNK